MVVKKKSSSKKIVTKKDVTSKTTIKNTKSAKKNSISSMFDGYQKVGDRIFLKPQREFEDAPDLLSLQKFGFDSLVNNYLQKLFEDITPVWDIAGEKMFISITDIKVHEAKELPIVCKKKELTYGGIITAKVKLVDSINKKTLFSKSANVGILPLMTSSATYIVNGVERVIISQMVRSYGVFYSQVDFKYWFKLIPERGPWLEVKIEKAWVIVARINKSRKFPITTLLRVFGAETDEAIKELFSGVIDEEDINYLDITLAKDTTTDALSAAKFIYNKLRPGELIDEDSALDYIKTQFLNPQRIYIGNIARRKINAKLGLDKEIGSDEGNLFDWSDLVASIKYLLGVANEKKWFYIDDADHLSNKRVRLMWEVLFSHLQPVMRKFVKSIKGKLSILNLEVPLKITSLVNFKIIDNAIKSFFATSQLSQFLDQINPLAEVEHKRRITVLWPGGLKRETAKFEVRDVHPSQYGRVCPIETPEWQNIWLVIYQGLYSNVTNEWFLESPAFKIFQDVAPVVSELVNRVAHRDIMELDSKKKETKKVIVKEDSYIDEKSAKLIEKHYGKLKTRINVKPFFTEEVVFISPEMDEKYYVADATTPVDPHNNILQKRVAARHFTEMGMFHVNDITHIDVSPAQIFSANTSLIPFVNHNDSVRAAVATNQQRQALPLLKNEVPFVGTGLERWIVKNTHAVIAADDKWEVVYVDGKRVKVKYKWGIKEYGLINFQRSNHKTCLHQSARVSLWQKVIKWDILAEGPCVEWGEIALWKNLRVAFMPWEGYNYEDAIVISQRLVKDDVLTSITIEEYSIEVSDTKLGPEETTNDIPGVSMSKLKNLDDDGVVRIGARVSGGAILVGKITPKSEWDLTPEEKLVQAIFGDKSKNVKDTSLYLPSGSEGKVIDVVILDAKKWDNVMAWVRKKIKIYVASMRKVEIGDKLAWKHGNKGIVAVVVPEEDMPYSEDWQPVDIVLNPLWVISRMNIWQLYESQLGLVAKALGIKVAVPIFSEFGQADLKALTKKAGLPEDLKFTMYDGRTWEPFSQKIALGYMHILKLVHMVEDKIHARSVWPYSLITQQPLWGKSRQWGQRFGEMEVRSLEAYSAVYTLQEMLTVKSDDVVWRNKLYESIIKWFKPRVWGLPESFNLATYLFKGLGQNIVSLNEEQIQRIHESRLQKILGLWLSGVMSKIEIAEETTTETQTKEEKEQIMTNVIQEMEDFGDIED